MWPLPKPQKVLIPHEELMTGIRRMGAALAERLAGRRVLMTPVLNGALRFAAELVGELREVSLEIEPVIVRSYAGIVSQPAQLDLLRLKPQQVFGVDLLLIDDIFDTGQTLHRLITELQAFAPASITCAVMLLKEGRCRPEHQVEIDFVGWTIPDEFVVGMGLDYRGYFRNLPDVRALSPTEQTIIDEALESRDRSSSLSANSRGP